MPVRLPRLPSLRSIPRSRWRRIAITGGIIVVLVAGLVTWAAWPAPHDYTTSDQMITVMTGPNGDQPVSLDTTYYKPRSASATDPVPAILLAHGFGGTKQSVADQANDFANRGYAVLAWTAQGMGRSGGEIHLDSPDWEVRDAQRLIDWLAARPEILKDGQNDPRVAAVGGSYGGALALMLAGQDTRVDAIVPMITWNDLANAFLPESTGANAAEGVFKKAWAGLFFGTGGGAGALDVSGLAAALGLTLNPSAAAPVAPDPQCGRFAKDVCAAYQEVATTGRASAATITLLRRSSPARSLDRIKAPTLLIQGQADSLFPLAEGEANYRGIAATGTPVRVDWFTGGHDGGAGPPSDQNRLKFLTITWLDFYLRGQGDNPGSGFTYSRVTGFDAETRRLTTSGFKTDNFPDPASGGTAPVDVTIAGPNQRIANPPGGNPAAITVLPGAGGGLASLLNGATIELPGQHAEFFSAPLPSTVDVVGTPKVQLRAASQTGSAVFFVKLYDVDPNSGSSLPFGLAAPVRLDNLPATIDKATPVTVTLPGIVHRFEAGHRLRLAVATSDQAYATPNEPAVYTVGLPSGQATITLPQVPGSPIANPEVIWRYALAALVALVLVGLAALLVVARLRRRRRAVAVVAEHEDTPLVVRGLRKEYADGFVAVSHVDFTVERGQVVGLLGPNGAGKTTSLRVLLGITQPTKGEILVFGHRLIPGADVLTRVGALVEGPGFLPHLSGLENLRLFWRTTGRPEADAHLDEALEIAGLGDGIHRKVRKYSHGMKQRLAIAQAMLGLPELLVLDEPTDGLDPPQIAEMRRVLRAYATDGRAVLVSSHLLAEVEQTCTHVVVMHKGEVVADGPVEDVVGDSPIALFDVSDVDAATTVLERMDGVRAVIETLPGGGLVVDLDGRPRTEVVEALVRAGVGVDRVVPRRRLEDAFLTLVGGETKASGER